jgi:hypothetical protein
MLDSDLAVMRGNNKGVLKPNPVEMHRRIGPRSMQVALAQ